MSDGDNLVAGDWDALQKMMRERGVLHANGGPVPLDYWEAWQGKKPINPDGTIQGTTGTLNPATGMVDYKLQDDAGFFGEFMNMAKIPLTFAGFALGANGITNWLSGASSAAGGATGAFDMGAGGVGEAMGLGDLPWGVNPASGGGMDWLNELLQQTGEAGLSPEMLEAGFNPAGSGLDLTQFLPSLPPLPPTTNMQDWITKLDSTPAGKDWLNKLIGGASDAAGATNLISKLLGSNTAANSLTSLLPKLLPSLLGVAGSAAQNKALEDIVGLQGQNRDALLAFGAPYRQRLAGLYDNPSGFLNSPEVQVPVQQATNAMARALSTQGNPVGNGTALQEMQNYSANQLFGRLGQEKDRLAGFGGLTAYNNAGANQFGNLQAQTALAQGEGNMWNALGYGLNQVLNPQPTLADLLKDLKGFNPSTSLV